MQTIIQVQQPEQTPEEVAQALAEAAKTAPTTEAEALAQIEAKKAGKKEPEQKPAEKAERPAHVPEKFWNAEKGVVDTDAMLKSYAELEKKVGAPKDEKKPEGDDKSKDDKPKIDKPEGEADAAPKAAEVVAKLNENFAANGKLSDDDYALAEKIGHDRATVDAFIAGQQALAEAATRRITDAAGGKDQMDAMFAWAKTGITNDEIDAFNATMNGSDVNAAVSAMEGLKAKYVAANGKDPVLLQAKPAGSSVDAYSSWAEVQADMAKPEYQKDHAFRTKVEQKLARSNNIR